MWVFVFIHKNLIIIHYKIAICFVGRKLILIKSEIDDYYWNFRITKDLIELRNLCLVAELIIRSAKQRKENIGLHYSIDYKDASVNVSNIRHAFITSLT